jgi:hypothetical protein
MHEIFKDISIAQPQKKKKKPTYFRQRKTLPTAEREMAIDQSWVGHLYCIQYG